MKTKMFQKPLTRLRQVRCIALALSFGFEVTATECAELADDDTLMQTLTLLYSARYGLL